MAENALSPFAGAQLIDREALLSRLQKSGELDPRGAGADGSQYLSFSGKGGRYEFGEKKREITPDEAWLVNIYSWKDGWTCWKGNRVLARHMVPAGDPVPDPDFDQHGPFPDGEGWKQTKRFVLRSIDSGEQADFSNNSVSGVSTFAGLQKDVIARLAAGLPEWPVIGLGKEKFTSGSFTNWKPVFEIMGWLDYPHVEVMAAAFNDDTAEVDLEAMFAASATGKSPAALTTGGEKRAEQTAPAKQPEPAQTVRRNRRPL